MRTRHPFRTAAQVLGLAAVLLAWVVIGGASAARAGETPVNQSEIQAVILQQMQAFKADDAAAAFGLASPMIQQKFGTAEVFMEMVRGAYEPVYRPRHVEFKSLEAGEDGPLQRAVIEGQNGEIVEAIYPMRRIDGVWRINGCYIVLLPRAGA